MVILITFQHTEIRDKSSYHRVVAAKVQIDATVASLREKSLARASWAVELERNIMTWYILQFLFKVDIRYILQFLFKVDIRMKESKENDAIDSKYGFNRVTDNQDRVRGWTMYLFITWKYCLYFTINILAASCCNRTATW